MLHVPHSFIIRKIRSIKKKKLKKKIRSFHADLNITSMVHTGGLYQNFLGVISLKTSNLVFVYLTYSCQRCSFQPQNFLWKSKFYQFRDFSIYIIPLGVNVDSVLMFKLYQCYAIIVIVSYIYKMFYVM